MGGSLLGIGIVVLIGAVIIGAVVISTVAAVVRWRDRVKIACCGSCRYPVQGLTTFTCPECGADLRSAGILVPGVRPRHRIHVAELFAAWMAVALLGAFITVGMLSALPGGNRTWFSRTETLNPVSSTFAGLTVTWTGTTPADSLIATAPASTASLWIPQQAAGRSLAKLEIDYAARQWELIPHASVSVGSRVQKPLPIAEADVAAWLASMSQTGPPPPAEIANLTSYLNRAGTGLDPAAFSSVSGLSKAVTAPARWAIVTSACLWIAICIAGCWLIARNSATRKRPRQTTPAAA